MPFSCTIHFNSVIDSPTFLQFVHNDEAVLLQTFPTVEEIGGIVDNDYLTISRFANAMTADIKVLNIRIVATWNRYNIYRYINYQVFVPRFLCQVSFGHLGSCDDNPANDYASPNDCEFFLPVM